MKFTPDELVFIYREMQYAKENLLQDLTTDSILDDIAHPLSLIASICEKVDQVVPTVGVR
jgi:hypothetical protein